MRATLDHADAAKPPREIELKLELDPCDADRLAGLALLHGIEGRVESMQTTYFDTDRLDLRDAGLSLRVREAAGRRVQTIKTRSKAAAGFFDRSEWESEVQGDGPDLAAAAGTALDAVLSRDGVRDGLRPIFTIRADRTTYPLSGEGWAADLTLDRGVVEVGARALPLCEIELELTQGRPADLFALARSLCEALPARPGIRTKADRGYALLADKRPKAVKAQDSPVASGMSVAAAFQAIGHACLHHLLGNIALLRDTRDPEVVHQMRVALRRLRAAISLFKDALADERRDAIRGELQWIANELGAARDLDVFIAQVLEPVRARHPDEPGLTALIDGFRSRREAAFERALADVESARFGTLLIDAMAWIEAGPWLTAAGDAVRSETVAAFAARELARRRKSIRKRGAKLEKLDPSARHRLRIAVKKLRYATEFFAPLHQHGKQDKRRAAFLDALEALQEHLGELNDVAVAREKYPELFSSASDDKAPAPRKAARLIVKHQTARADAALKPALKAYRDIAEAKPFWKRAVTASARDR